MEMTAIIMMTMISGGDDCDESRSVRPTAENTNSWRSSWGGLKSLVGDACKVLLLMAAVLMRSLVYTDDVIRFFLWLKKYK